MRKPRPEPGFRAFVLEAGVYRNRTDSERCSHPPQVLKTWAITRCANTPKVDKLIVRLASRGGRRAPRGFEMAGQHHGNGDKDGQPEPFTILVPTSGPASSRRFRSCRCSLTWSRRTRRPRACGDGRACRFTSARGCGRKRSRRRDEPSGERPRPSCDCSIGVRRGGRVG